MFTCESSNSTAAILDGSNNPRESGSIASHHDSTATTLARESEGKQSQEDETTDKGAATVEKHDEEERTLGSEATITLTTSSTSIGALQGQAEYLKNAAQKSLIDGAIQRTHALIEQHPKATVDTLKGWAAEIHHEVTFNHNAIEAGSAYRAQVVPGNQAADLRIYNAADASTTLETAQVKMRPAPKLNQVLNQAKYDGMQKVVPEGLENANSEWNSKVQYNNIKSESLALDKSKNIVQNPEQHYDSMRPNVRNDALAAGAQAAVLGAGIGAAISLGTTLVTKGKIEKADAIQAAESAAVGAAAGGTAAVTAVVSGNAAAAGVVGGAVVTVYSVLKCPDGEMKVEEAVQGIAGTGASVVTMLGCSALGIGTGGLGLLVGAGATMLAHGKGRAAGRAVFKWLRGRPSKQQLKDQKLQPNSDKLPPDNDEVQSGCALLQPNLDQPLPESDQLLPESDRPLPETDQPLPERDQLLPESEMLQPEVVQLQSGAEELLPEAAQLQSQSAELQSSALVQPAMLQSNVDG